MSRIKYDEYALAQEAKVKLIPFDFVEKDGVISAHSPKPPVPSDVASIVFTYQAQGSIKGVVLTHSNMVNMAKDLLVSHIIAAREGINENDMHFSFFPLARIFERTVVTLMLYSGACVAFKVRTKEIRK
jgi:long-chain acyl-CoA synthetase